MLEAKYSRNNDDLTKKGVTLSNPEGELWPAPETQSPLDATVVLPGSKSLMARELVLAAMANSPSLIQLPLVSRDSQLMIEALEALGTRIETAEDTLLVTPAPELLGSTSISCGLAGTVMRFIPALACLALGPTVFDGDSYARKRPMRGVIEALRDLGADIADEGRGALPFTVHGNGSLKGGYVEIDSSESSQFVSALLLAGSQFEEGVHVKHIGESLPSIPHIEMTIECLRLRGVKVTKPAIGEWQVEPGAISGRNLVLESDLSNAAPFLAAALVTGGKVTVPNWPNETTQVGDKLRDFLPKFGAEVTFSNGNLTVTSDGHISANDLHMSEAGELAPTMIGLAALADGPSTITGIGHIRHHETDRIAALANECRKIGCEVEELDDGLRIVPPNKYVASDWNSYDDHRMATTGALVGLRVPGTQIINIESTSKTMPRFTEMWNQMLGVQENLP